MNMIEILEKLGEMDLIRLHKITGDYYTIYCPIHKGGQERRPSCGVLLKDICRNGRRYPQGFCHCFSCGYHNDFTGMISDILKNKNISKSGAEWLQEHIPEYMPELEVDPLLTQDIIDSFTAKEAVAHIQNLLNPQKISYVTEEELSKYRYTVPYMYERKLTDPIIERYDIGFDAHHIPEGKKKELPCITFPVRNIQGDVVFVARRSVEGKYFNYPRNIEKPVYGLYELPKDCSRVVICESFFNALTCVAYGWPAVALMGTGTPYQMDMLKRSGIREFVLGFDPDKAGDRATKKWRRALRDVGVVWSFEGIPEGKDINDLTLDEFNSLKLV